MALTYSTALVYCLEPDVARYGAYVWDESSDPTDDQVYEYAQDVAAAVEAKTEMAGDKITPTAALSRATRVKRVLEQANAVGAAMLARLHMFSRSGSQRDLQVAERLAATYDSLMGAGASSGGAAGTGEGGLVGDVVASAGDTNLLANQVTQGEVTLKSLTTRTNVEPEFAITDPE